MPVMQHFHCHLHDVGLRVLDEKEGLATLACGCLSTPSQMDFSGRLAHHLLPNRKALTLALRPLPLRR